MATRTVDPIFLPFVITTPPGTTAAAPLVTQLAVRHGILEAVDLAIPPGHNGMTGFALRLAQELVLPYGGIDPWIIGDNLQESFPTNLEIDQGVTAATYNLGVYEHRHYLRLRIRLQIAPSVPPTVQLAPLSALNAGVN